MTPTDAQKAILAIEKQLSVLRSFTGMPTEAPAKKGRGGKKNKTATVTSDEEPKKKRELTPQIAAMNEERKTIFEELKSAWNKANPDYVSLDAAALKTAVSNGEVEQKPRFSDALKEHSRRKREGDPEKQAKYDAYRAKVELNRAEKTGANSVSSGSVSDTESVAPPQPNESEKKERKNPWLGISDEERAERVAKMQAGKAAKKEAAAAAIPAAVTAPVAAPVIAPVTAPVTVVAEKRPVKKAASSKAAPVKEEKVEIISASADDEEAFSPFELKGTHYWKNGLQYVYKKTSDGGFGDYAGRYDVPKRKIDASVPEPLDE